MKIIVQPSDSVEIREFFDFNQINYESLSLWNTDTELYSFSKIPSDDISLTLIDYLTFNDIISNDISLNELLRFISYGNKVWVWSDFDSVMFLKDKINDLIKLDLKISSGLTLWHDVQWTIDTFLNFKNIKIATVPYDSFIRPSRIFKSSIQKSLNSKDFMITTITKNLERQTLIKGIIQRNLDKNGHVISSPIKNYEKWVGLKSTQHTFHEGYPSMDLYRNSWMEIVPETLTNSAYFITEKTIKPMNTETPFVISSTSGYLKYLKNLGFKTFGTLIDESYDEIDNAEQRIDRILDIVKDICNNGAKSFYESSKHILEHNRSHVGMIYGSRRYEHDCIIWQELESCLNQ